MDLEWILGVSGCFCVDLGGSGVDLGHFGVILGTLLAYEGDFGVSSETCRRRKALDGGVDLAIVRTSTLSENLSKIY